MGVGVLTLEKFVCRADIAYGATSPDQLAVAIQDLPAAPIVGTRKSVKWLVGLFGDEKRSGPWRADDVITAVNIFGDVAIDLRGAYVKSDEVLIRFWGLFGDAKVTVPEGVEVDLSGFCLFGDRKLEVAPLPRIPGTPRIRVIAYSLFGDAIVRSNT